MANALRGEVAALLGGRELILRPTFEAIVAIETRLGGVVGLAMKAAEGQYGLREAAAVLWETLDKSRHPDLSEAEIGRLILEDGLAAALRPMSEVLATVLNGLTRRS